MNWAEIASFYHWTLDYIRTLTLPEYKAVTDVMVASKKRANQQWAAIQGNLG